MDTTEFLRRILPPQGSGVYCWLTPATHGFNQRFTDDVSKVVNGVTLCDEQHLNTYYAMASFKVRGNRTHDNVACLKSFWVDIDCGPEKAAAGKGYATQKEGAKAMLVAIDRLNLPKPICVRSGNGLHMYWPLAEAVDVERWALVAHQLVAALQSMDVIADWPCSADQSRILRPVGTHNWKDPNNPKLVEVAWDAPDCRFEDMAHAVQHFEVELPAVAMLRDHINSDLDIQYDTTPGDANLIANECGHMRLMRESRGALPEPEWKDCLSIIKACGNAEEIAVEWSKGDPRFSRSATLKKMAQRPGPARCVSFAKHNKNICTSCQHNGNITSPIQLGRQDVLAASDAPDEDELEAQQPIARETVAAVITENWELPEELKVRGWTWHEQKKILLKAASGAPAKRVCDALIVGIHTVIENGKVCAVFRARLAYGGSKPIKIKGEDFASKDPLLKSLYSQGITPVVPAQGADLASYMQDWYGHLCRKAKESAQYQHYGWQPDGSFLLGTTLYSPGGIVRTVETSYDINQMNQSFTPVGTAEEWRNAISTLYAGSGMEQYLFMIGVGFGAPLMELTGIHGVMMSALSTTGYGKTAAEECMLSIWGSPSSLLKTFKGMTVNAMYEHIGVMHSLPVVVDEITEAKPDEVGKMVYDVSSGNSKVRLDRNGVTRDTRAQWYTIVQTSSNKSMWEMLSYNKVVNDAQWVRMLEYRMQRVFTLDNSVAAALLLKIKREQYGTVGHIYAHYLVDHREEITAKLIEMHALVDRLGNVRTSERFWSAGIACVVTGLAIANKLGLISVDAKRVLAWAIQQVEEGRRSLVTNAPTLVDQFRLMINDLGTMHTLITPELNTPDDPATRADANSGRAEIYARLIGNINQLWVSRQHVKQWCGKVQASYAEVIRAAYAAGIIMKEEKFSLGQGTIWPTALEDCLLIDYIKLQEK